MHRLKENIGLISFAAICIVSAFGYHIVQVQSSQDRQSRIDRCTEINEQVILPFQGVLLVLTETPDPFPTYADPVLQERSDEVLATKKEQHDIVASIPLQNCESLPKP